jgi:hypothetical protein
MFLLYYLSGGSFHYLDQVNFREQAFERLCYREKIPFDGKEWETSFRGATRQTRYEIFDSQYLYHFVV